MKARLARTGKQMGLTAPQFFFASQRQLADTAYAGDWWAFRTTEPCALRHTDRGRGAGFPGCAELLLAGNPAPCASRRRDEKAKKLKEALQQMAEEGVVQLFSPEDGSPAIVGVVGALQLDVLKERLQQEYGLPVSFEMSRFSVCRWISADIRPISKSSSPPSAAISAETSTAIRSSCAGQLLTAIRGRTRTRPSRWRRSRISRPEGGVILNAQSPGLPAGSGCRSASRDGGAAPDLVLWLQRRAVIRLYPPRAPVSGRFRILALARRVDREPQSPQKNCSRRAPLSARFS